MTLVSSNEMEFEKYSIFEQFRFIGELFTFVSHGTISIHDHVLVYKLYLPYYWVFVILIFLLFIFFPSLLISIPVPTIISVVTYSIIRRRHINYIKRSVAECINER